jgi:hypothetical protein
MDGRRGEAKSHKSGSSGSENLYKARRGVKSSNDPIRSSHPEIIRHRRIRFTAVSHAGLTQEAPPSSMGRLFYTTVFPTSFYFPAVALVTPFSFVKR